MEFDVLSATVNSITTDLSPSISPEVLKQILANPAMLEQLSDRVYTFLKNDLKNQRERSQGYGRRF